MAQDIFAITVNGLKAGKNGVPLMNKIAKIAIVVGLVAVVGVVIALKQGWRSPASTEADKSRPGAEAADPETADRPGAETADRPRAGVPRLVDLGAGKCIPCIMMAPILEELKKEYAGRLRVETIDVWENPEAGRKFGIRLIPTQIFYDASGKELYRHEGYMSKEDILAKWKELGVDLSTTPPSKG